MPNSNGCNSNGASSRTLHLSVVGVRWSVGKSGGRVCLQTGPRSGRRLHAGAGFECVWFRPLVAPPHRLQATAVTRRVGNQPVPPASSRTRTSLINKSPRVALVAWNQCRETTKACRRVSDKLKVASCGFAAQVASNLCHPALGHPVSPVKSDAPWSHMSFGNI